MQRAASVGEVCALPVALLKSEGCQARPPVAAGATGTPALAQQRARLWFALDLTWLAGAGNKLGSM